MYYNTTRNYLEMREYGRNVQRMVEFTVKEKDKEKRQRMAEAIVELMGQMNPHLRNVEEFRHKLWDHLYFMSNFELEVDSPYPKPPKDVLQDKPQHIGYPKHKIGRPQYGKNVETMIKKAMEMDDPEKQKAFAEVIGNYMKLVSQNWNKETVNDLIIKEDIKALSGGKLTLDEDSNLDALTRSTRKRSGGRGRDNRKGKGGHKHRRKRN